MAIMKLRESLFIFVVWRDNWREFVPEFVSSYWIDSTELIHSVSSFPYPSILQLWWRNEFLKSTISTIFLCYQIQCIRSHFIRATNEGQREDEPFERLIILFQFERCATFYQTYPVQSRFWSFFQLQPVITRNQIEFSWNFELMRETKGFNSSLSASFPRRARTSLC